CGIECRKQSTPSAHPGEGCAGHQRGPVTSFDVSATPADSLGARRQRDTATTTRDDAGASQDAASGARGPARIRDVVSAYVGLTKPRIIELLLITTVPAMFLAAGGIPSLTLVLWTLLGGCLAAGSANVFNCVLDRDIDERMRRTRRRT